MNLSYFIAQRYLRHQKGAFSAFIIRLAIVATALSVATMVVAMAFVTGFQYEVREKIFSFWGHVHITPFSPNTNTIITPDPIHRDLVLEQQVMDGFRDVRSIDPFVIRPVILNANSLMEGIQLKGVDGDYELPAAVSFTGNRLSYSDTDYAKQVLLSQTTADRMNISVGDDLQLYFLEPGSTFPRIRKVKLAGIFHTGMEEVDKQYGICDIRLLQRINNWNPDDINGYQVSLTDEQLSDTVASLIYQRYLQPPLTTYTMREIFPNIIDWLKMQDVTTAVIINIMTVVAIINLTVVLLILIVEHARMVGLLTALGMPRNGIRRVFMYHSSIIAFWGILLGNILGLGFCWLQSETGFIELPESTYYIKQVAVRLEWEYLVAIDIATYANCVFWMWLPSLYIRRIKPAKVLQFK